MGPCAPLACQLGKYETFTSTGVPTCETWKPMVESVVVMAETFVVGTCLTAGLMSVTEVRGHDDGPLWASSTFQLGRVERTKLPTVSASSKVPAGLTPESTTGSLCSGVTSGRVAHHVDVPRRVRETPL